jgi:hypothetical protein
MTLYQETAKMWTWWPEPIEGVYQMLGDGPSSELAPKLPQLTRSDILFMTAVINLPHRPWGIVTWMADVFQISRQGLYDLTVRVTERLSLAQEEEQKPALSPEAEEVLWEKRLRRTVLTAAFPGKMAIRPMQALLKEALGESRSIGWVSELLTEAGQRAGEVLSQIDFSELGPVIVVRDEKFFQNHPLLMVIEPASAAILFLQVLPDRQAETWALALLELQDQGLAIAGVVEDMARMYVKSLEEAELDAPVQKDVWHLMRDGSQLLKDLEREAFRATKKEVALHKKLEKAWDDALFEQYVLIVEQEEDRYEMHAAFSNGLDHLYDALEVVDWRSGEIRDRAINQWLLSETIQALAAIDHPRVQKWVKRLRRHQETLLNYLDWLDAALKPIEAQVAQLLENAKEQRTFVRLVARHWRLQQALTNGHRGFASLLETTTQALDTWLIAYPALRPLVHVLQGCLQAAVRSSAMIENINGILEQFLHNRRSFRNEVTLQHYLNLFALWHNMRPFARGKRQGQSPYQRAGIRLGFDDWLTLIGYPPAA